MTDCPNCTSERTAREKMATSFNEMAAEHVRVHDQLTKSKAELAVVWKGSAERYWEARWRDADRELTEYRKALTAIAEGEGDPQEIARQTLSVLSPRTEQASKQG